MHLTGKLPGAEAALDPDAATREAAETAKADAQKRSAARQFEGVLMQQLLKVMRETAKSGTMGSSDGASGQYLSMFDEVMANAMAEGGGIGLADTIYRTLGGTPPETQKKQALPGAADAPIRRAVRGGVASEAGSGPTPPLAGLRGATSKLAQAAYALSAPEGGKQWGREGTLTARDLGGLAATNGDQARFSTGFRDSYKCNLFAFEAARRAGFEVPIVERAHGLGYPTSNTVTSEAASGQVRGNWASVVSGPQIAALQSALGRGEVGLMLAGSGSDGRAGHMALVERIHDVQLDRHGEVQRIEFDGYEARADGAQHLLRRTWNRQGHGDDSKHARNGFAAIELLALRRADAHGNE